MQSMPRPQRLGRATITLLIVFGLAVTQPVPAGADDNVGESAIDAAFDQLSPDDPEPEEAPPPAEEPQAAEAPPADTAGATEPAPAADSGGAEQAAGAAAAPETVAAAEQPAPAADTATASDAGASGAETVSAQQTGEQPAQGGNERRSDSGEQGLAQSAISNVLSGGVALETDPALPALAAAAPISGGTESESGSASGAADGGLREVTSEQAADLRAAGNSLRPASHTPGQTRNAGEAREGDQGTVVVNALEDSGDEGSVAVHGHIVAGTLCDGSQFWSLDGGGTVNANGVNLSANGGTAASDARGGDDNIGGAAGNGGSAGASADGGIVVVDRLVTGNNTGNQVSVGDQTFTGDCGQGVIDGGDATTISNVNISADGGVALADARGGDNNVAGNGGSAGNGGTARASADGGLVIVGDLILGNNEGNTIDVNSSGSGGSGGSGSSGGGCLIDGGTVVNEANIDISADGGLALADASGGDDNAAFGGDAEAGNGGRARANADGGFILVGDITTGNNQGNSISGQCGGGGSASGGTFVYGGDVVNQTTLTFNADGGVAIADAAGGDNNIAAGGQADDVAAGNGGRATADASGGVIWVGDITTGNNVGHVIAFGATNLAPVPDRDDDDDKKERPIRTIKPTFAAPKKQTGRLTSPQRVRTQPAGRRAVAVGKLPDTGTGPALVAGSTATAGLVVAGIAVIGVAGVGYAGYGRRQSFASTPRRSTSR